MFNMFHFLITCSLFPCDVRIFVDAIPRQQLLLLVNVKSLMILMGTSPFQHIPKHLPGWVMLNDHFGSWSCTVSAPASERSWGFLGCYWPAQNVFYCPFLVVKPFTKVDKKWVIDRVSIYSGYYIVYMHICMEVCIRNSNHRKRCRTVCPGWQLDDIYMYFALIFRTFSNFSIYNLGLLYSPSASCTGTTMLSTPGHVIRKVRGVLTEENMVIPSKTPIL